MPKVAKARTKRTKIADVYRRGEKNKLDRHWRAFFLDHLAETSNVTAAAHFAGVNPSRAYKVRREDAAFARKWYAALLEGYEHLELETLRRLREGVPADGPKFDIANALRLLMRTRLRERRQSDTLSLRIAALDPKVGPGSIVRVPDHPGLWQVTAWEWREIGIELDLQRHATATPVAAAADSGAAWDPPDRQAVGSLLRAFELPWDGTGPDGQPQRFAAVGALDGRWAGAALYHLRDGALIPLGESGPDRAVGGRLLEPLAPSRGLRFEPAAGLHLRLDHEAPTFEPATTTALAQGANRLLVGGEIIQFARCEALGEGEWRLFGLLRGRGGTEHHALVGHSAGTPATALDERLWALAGDVEFDANSRLAAIGHADDEPVYATLEGSGSTRRPLSPVHPRQRYPREGGLELSWTRRARGGWHWLNEVEQPLVEQDEIYEIGIGEPAKPERIWTSDQPRFHLSAASLADVAAAYPGQPVWVRQSGSYARSLPLLLTHLPSTI